MKKTAGLVILKEPAALYDGFSSECRITSSVSTKVIVSGNFYANMKFFKALVFSIICFASK